MTQSQPSEDKGRRPDRYELLWKIGSEDRLRQHVRIQDAKFQDAIRQELRALAADRGMRLVEKPPEKPVRPRLPRDIIRIEPTVSFSRIPAQVIMKQVCEKHGVSNSELVGQRRAYPVVAARQEAMYRLSRETTLSLPAIAQRLGRECHTTVINGIRRYEATLRGEVYHKKRYGKALKVVGL